MVATQFAPLPLLAQAPLLVKYTILMGCTSVVLIRYPSVSCVPVVVRVFKVENENFE